MPREQRYTDWWDHKPSDGIDQGLSEHSSLDHMLCSSALFSKLAAVRIEHAIAPMDYSDHWPIIATFDLSASRAPVASPVASPVSMYFKPARVDLQARTARMQWTIGTARACKA